ncbi:hypothetical protein QUF70_02285 [Desulfobacterales bacterium HSG17]|nr:hypothetical protein [Desulfobacterales bacterium HSG17]
MANSYIQIYLHYVFAVQGRQNLIHENNHEGEIKSNSSRFINKKQWIMGKFQWQKGYGA